MAKHYSTASLESLPNVGKSIANDLRGIGVTTPQQLANNDPLKLYLKLGSAMGQRHDPCVLYTLMAAKHYVQTGEAVKWGEFTEEGRVLLEEMSE